MARVMLNIRNPNARHRQQQQWPTESIPLDVYIHTTETRAVL